MAELDREDVVIVEAAETDRNSTCFGSCLDLFVAEDDSNHLDSVMLVAVPQSYFCSRLQGFSPELMHYSIDQTVQHQLLLRNFPSFLCYWGFLREPSC